VRAPLTFMQLVLAIARKRFTTVELAITHQRTLKLSYLSLSVLPLQFSFDTAVLPLPRFLDDATLQVSRLGRKRMRQIELCA
jgi:hypothetical protein